MITKQMINELPNSVQKWLLNSGIIGKKPIRSVFLQQELQLKMKPRQKEWYNAKAKQCFTIEPPAFSWSLDLKIKSLIPIVGKDKFENGKGEMCINLFSIIPLVNLKDNSKLNQAALQRYLAEIVWFPSAALSPFISWVQITDTSVKATMSYLGTKGSGTFYFNKNGDFEKFEAMRYKDVEENSEPKLWTVKTIKTEERNGIRIPVELNADWKLENGNWTWLKLKINEINYNA